MFKYKSPRVPTYSANSDIQRALEKWGRLEKEGLLLVYPLSEWHAWGGMMKLSILEQWMSKQSLLSASLIEPEYVIKQRKSLQRSEKKGYVVTGMPEEIAVVLEVPPQNILRATTRPLQRRSTIGQGEYDLANTVLFDSSADSRREGVPARYTIETPRNLMAQTRGKENEVLLFGKPYRRIHGVVTGMIKVKGVICLGHDRRGVLTGRNRLLRLEADSANYSFGKTLFI